MRKTLAFIALAIAGFTFGFAACGDDDDNGSPSDTGTVTTSGDTTTDGTSTEDTTTGGTTERSKTNEDDGGYGGKGGGGGDREGSPPGRLAQLGEHQLDKLGVTGSSPVPPISRKPRYGGGVATSLANLLV
jgi:hypothetical protein